MKNLIKLGTITIIALFLIVNLTAAQDAPEKAEKVDKKCKMEKSESMKECCKDKDGKKDEECKKHEDKKDGECKMKEGMDGHGKMEGHEEKMDHSKMEGMDHSKMMGMSHDKMGKHHDKMGDSIVQEGAIDISAIDANKDGKVFQDQMDWNVISDEAGECPICGMKLKEVSIDDAKKNLLKNGFKLK